MCLCWWRWSGLSPFGHSLFPRFQRLIRRCRYTCGGIGSIVIGMIVILIVIAAIGVRMGVFVFAWLEISRDILLFGIQMGGLDSCRCLHMCLCLCLRLCLWWLWSGSCGGVAAALGRMFFTKRIFPAGRSDIVILMIIIIMIRIIFDRRR